MSGITPWVLVSPSVPRSETRLDALAGPHSESPVWVPSAAAAMLVATATAEPPLDPIELFDESNEFHTWPKALGLKWPSVVNSARLALPITIAPAARSWLSRYASDRGWKLSKTRLPPVVGSSAVS